MSSDIAIEASDLSKAYKIYRRPSDRLAQAVMPRLRRLAAPLVRLGGGTLAERNHYTDHWALHGLSFQVPRGDSMAIIGRNGSGKSTLLQLICGTLMPTSGTAHVNGKVAALLELGSGFNPEFTGRENVFLNASILGMTREQTEARLPDILTFADIGDFVEQPVKTYSTGMAMRLAFAVIAHVDAEILIIDEALAVGDAYFQQKCMRWLRQFRERGTVLFCGHDIGAVMSLCDTALWLDKGHLIMQGPAKDVCEAYSASVMAQTQGLIDGNMPAPAPKGKGGGGKVTADKTSENKIAEDKTAEVKTAAARPEDVPPPEPGRSVIFDVISDSTAFGSGKAIIRTVALTVADGSPLSWIRGGEDVRVSIEVDVLHDIEAPIVGFHCKDRLGQPILGDNTFLTTLHDPLSVEAGKTLRAAFVFQLPALASGRYSISAACASGTLDTHVQHHWLHDALVFDVHSPFKNGVLIAVEMQHIQLQTRS
jgi:lipopolysaccharide transport system ATP-binding protein